MPPMGFKLTISAGERPQTYALDCAATATGRLRLYFAINVTTPQITGLSLDFTVLVLFWGAI